MVTNKQKYNQNTTLLAHYVIPTCLNPSKARRHAVRLIYCNSKVHKMSHRMYNSP